MRQDNATVIDMLVDLISGVNPAVKSELDSLKSFTANPGTANTAAEAEEKLVNWQSARKRLVQLGATDMATSEATSALNQIVEHVVRQHEGFQHRYSNLIHATSDIPTAVQARDIENLIRRELADCAGKDPPTTNRQWPHVAVNRMDARVDAAANGDGHGTPSPPTGTIVPPTAQSRPDGQQTLPGGQQPGQPNQPWPPKRNRPCRFWAAGRCIKGNECDWLHVGPAGTALVEGAQQPGGVEVAKETGENPVLLDKERAAMS